MTTPPDDTRADEGLVEAMAKAAYLATVGYDPADTWYDEYPHCDPSKLWPDRLLGMGASADTFRKAARAALTAARSHGGM